jgi:cyclophilin family peptidyl-prolyl cis-trans isomerase/HEAT repeat protein
MRNSLRFLVWFGFLPAILAAQRSPRAAVDTAALQRILIAEDWRGSGPEGVVPITEGLKSPTPIIRKTAIRALGRLQRPSLAAPLIEALGDGDADIRAIAADALAQAMQGTPQATVSVAATQVALTAALLGERLPATAGAIARSLGRLQFADSAAARRAETAILDASERTNTLGTMRALYSIAQRQRVTGPLSTRAISLVRDRGLRAPDAAARRVSLLLLATSRLLDSTTILTAVTDADPQVRQLAVAGVGAVNPDSRIGIVRRAFDDSSVLVRLEAPRAARVGSQRPDCSPIHAALGDRATPVVLAALDALGEPCADSSIVGAKLDAFTAKPRSGPDNLAAGSRQWHAAAHALVALAHVDSARAVRRLPRFVTAGAWQARAYAARAAEILRDVDALRSLAADVNHNVVEAAIGGLSRTAKHDADGVYIGALHSSGYQVQIAATAALADSPDSSAVPALLDAFFRLTAERRENSRDARVAILKRIGALGSGRNTLKLDDTADFDSTVSREKALAMTKLNKFLFVDRPEPLAIRHEPLARIARSNDLRLRITMMAGGVITVKLHADEAPATVARIVRLARAHYYDGLTFHRIVPNFVIQGGSPDATEYVGDGPFMRDELGLRSHDRGTLGISTRGRDTGDAQLFVNLVDNPRLDHDYTVFGTIVSGLPVIDGVFEGDIIAKIEVLGPTRSR